MKNKGTKFSSGEVLEWLDCGNKDATIHTNSKVLENTREFIDKSAKLINTEIISPCFIGENTTIKNSKIGPHVSIGKNTHIEKSIIKNSIIQDKSKIINTNIVNSMVGNNVLIHGNKLQQELSIGDFSEIKQ